MMICLILAAGYATRLYPLTENFPKPLLRVGEKTILDWLLDDINTAKSEQATPAINLRMVVTNHKYALIFQEWCATKGYPIVVADDGTLTNETRLGAVKDIQFAIEQFHLNDDLLVIAGDNVLDFSLTRFITYAKEKRTSCIMRFYQANSEKLHKTGVAVVDENDLVLDMEEKPTQPKSHWCTPPFYYFTREDVKLVKQGIEAGCGTDAPGSFIAWLSKQVPVHAMKMPGNRYDIGNLESYREVQKKFKGILQSGVDG